MVDKNSAIVVPIITSEIPMVREVLRFWNDRNPPFVPGQPGSNMDLVYVLPGEESGAVRQELEEIIDEGGVKPMFSEVKIHFAAIPESHDYYIRDPRGLPPTEEGFIAGPNRVFFEIAKSVGPQYEWCFLMELDCLPLRAGWGNAVLHEMASHAESWVVGSRYHGWSWLGPALDQHLNGNALYRFGDDSFQKFVNEVWEPGMNELVKWGYPGLAFDCYPSILSALASGPLVSREVRAMAVQGYGRFRESSLILNLSGSEDARSKFGSVEGLLDYNPMTFLFHANWLMDELGMKLPRSTESVDLKRPDRTSDLEYCVKNVFADKGAWLFGDLFAFRAKESAVVLRIIFDKAKVRTITFQVREEEDLRLTARRWSEKRVGGTGIIKLLASVLSVFGLRKRHGIAFREFLAARLLRLGSSTRTDVIGTIRIWLGEMRGRRVASGHGKIKIDMDSLGKANGITLMIRSESENLVEGRIQIDVERND